MGEPGFETRLECMVENGAYLLIAAEKIGDSRLPPQRELNAGEIAVLQSGHSERRFAQGLAGMVPALKPRPQVHDDNRPWRQSFLRRCRGGGSDTRWTAADDN